MLGHYHRIKKRETSNIKKTSSLIENIRIKTRRFGQLVHYQESIKEQTHLKHNAIIL